MQPSKSRTSWLQKAKKHLLSFKKSKIEVAVTTEHYQNTGAPDIARESKAKAGPHGLNLPAIETVEPIPKETNSPEQLSPPLRPTTNTRTTKLDEVQTAGASLLRPISELWDEAYEDVTREPRTRDSGARGPREYW